MIKIKHYILFHNHTNGIKLESLLKKEKIKYIISPTPRQLSASCGISIIYNEKDEEKIKKIIKENHIETAGFHTIKKEIKNFYC
ncbi:DUF3343 domain-containing protein [Haloimpatiens sp. FM7330]|uniref:DUF3343 domain-containing protein n=1 Tax=Haloimpatiens sp. FM7330 TaxID=3298610 RepID=UPI0036264D41